ncbi:hypothetical protein TrST_g5937 [Triparma strigata]|uniref:Kinesin light chain n=1 Tax=Triparma strigata TaxID=1606541 RepID=A0A9W7EU99_9STRA|nr:hypothetical protein TrST_g5937 [Triparma strigata]
MDGGKLPVLSPNKLGDLSVEDLEHLQNLITTVATGGAASQKVNPPTGQADPPPGQANPPPRVGGAASQKENPPTGQADPPPGQANPPPGPNPLEELLDVIGKVKEASAILKADTDKDKDSSPPHRVISNPKQNESKYSWDVFGDLSLLMAASRRLLEVLELSVPAPVEEKNARGKKKKVPDPWKLEVLDACYALGDACSKVRDDDDMRRYFKRAKKGYEEQLGPDSEKALEVTYRLIMVNCRTQDEKCEKLTALMGRMGRALGDEHVLTLDTLEQLGSELRQNGELEPARKVWWKCWNERERVLGKYDEKTLRTVNNLGIVYYELERYEVALECYNLALDGFEKTLGMTHPTTLETVMNIASVLDEGFKDYGKAEELFQRALEGKETQLGKDHEGTMRCAENYRNCLQRSGNSAGLIELKKSHPNVESYDT